MAPSKGMEDKDNPPTLVFSGETNDWPAFKDAIQMRADKHDTTWLFEGGRSLAEFLARQIKEKTGSDKKVCKKALEREKVASDSNHVPTSVDAYTDDALKEWFADKDCRHRAVPRWNLSSRSPLMSCQSMYCVSAVCSCSRASLST